VIVGVGIDVVPIERFGAAIERTAQLIDRLFTPAEQVTGHGLARTAESLAARFAAKEAVAKALGSPGGMSWHDCEIVVDERGRPSLRVIGTVAAKAAELGVRSWHVSLSHDGGIASAVVIAEG
jgi:holo-[acyl-carrier protein] synthase